MPTTVTLDPDTEQLIRRSMRERGLSFKQAVNEAIRLAERLPSAEPIDWPTYDMGEPRVDITKALRIAGELENDEIERQLRQGK